MSDNTKALPTFLRKEIERAIDEALHPKGMSTHDGKVRIGADRLQYLLAYIDRLAAAPTPAAQAEPPKDHEIAQAVNALRDVAREFHAHDSLRERIAHVAVPLMKRAAPAAQAEPTPPEWFAHG